MNKPYLLKKRIENIKILIIQIILVITFFIAWELFAKYNLIDSFLFSQPSKIFITFNNYLKGGELFYHIRISVIETLLGLIIGTSIGIIFAIILWWFKKMSKILMPFLIIFNSLPKTALAPIIIIWVGTGISGIVVVAISISIVMTILTAYNNFIQVEEEKIKMMRSFNASKWQILIKLILPANFVNIVTIIKINIGLAWVGVIVGEFLVSKAGLGYLIVYGTGVFKLDLVMMGILVLAIIAFLMYEIVNVFEKYLNKKRGL